MIFLNILLSLLKFIGIALLAVLGLVLLIVCLLLFVPIRYHITLQYKDKLDVGARVSFLLKLVRVRFELHGKEQALTAKVLWFNLLSDKKKTQDSGKASKTPKRKRSAKHGKGQAQETAQQARVQEEQIQVQEQEQIQIQEQVQQEIQEQTQEKVQEQPGSLSAEPDKDPKKEPQSSGKGRRSEKKSKKTGRKTAASGKEKGAGSAADTVRAVVSLIKENKRILSFLWKQIKALFRHILPGSHVIRVKLGLDDPATLGQIIGAVAVVRAATNLVIDITPDFQEKVVWADCRFKGRIRLGKLLFIALRVYFNKDVKNILNRIKN